MNSKLDQSELQAGHTNYTPARSALTPAGLMGLNSQVLGHQTVPTVISFTGNQSHLVTELLTNKLIIITNQSGLTLRRAGLGESCFFTETNSHHTVIILKSFIFMHYMASNKLLNFVFMHNTAIQKVQFFGFMGIAQLHAEMTCLFYQLMFLPKIWYASKQHISM